jgi:hypothetical protein
MNEILASLVDINTFLPDDKALMGDADDDAFQIDTARIIKGNLAGVFQPTTLAAWSNPANTPDLIRGIAGRMIAARWYAKLYSEDDTTLSEYAQSLYVEAVGMLNDIRGGSLVVLGPDDNPVETNLLVLSDAVFWPNDSTPGPYFTMTTEFG